ncbi:CorA family divalent cation transporter [Aminicella lysinilytica]|uniref:CorA-like Mg2+ transporter protein n=1 Tax=Aminicella lysinilytica TaxID=433323 RepID=A0A4R6Q5I6_9FIRM|nr:CorA family divalent cation transporter [Aminicella lysinilytica]NLD10330.1 hypothetical protein [Clostridiales bacterium]TDP57285.1 CorA-like Mg2+ transporter protein [Aminicella lysinilytica]
MIETYGPEQVSELYKYLKEKTVAHIEKARNYVLPIGENKYLMSFHSVRHTKVWIYADDQRCKLATDDEKILSYAANIDEESGIMEMFEFFLALTSEDVYGLEALENRISKLEDDLLTTGHPNKEGSNRIVTIRKEVLHNKRYYEQMEFLTDELAELNSSFNFIDKKFDRLLEFNMHLQEYVEQVREAYQSQIDIEQNNIMKIFTVVTTVFLPLTLITGWFGMNLKMPEFGWAFGYAYVIGLSVAVLVIMIIFFKKKKWF